MANSRTKTDARDGLDTYPTANGRYPTRGPLELDVSKRETLAALSPAMREVAATIARLGPSRATVLVAGERGSGKSLVARAIHAASPRATGPLVTLDCPGTPPDSFEEALFGAPAFGPANLPSMRGALEAAERGTLFLREVGALPLVVQPRLLRFLDDAEPTALGTRGRRRDVRLVASTSEDLAKAVASGRFRNDLRERLELVVLCIPALDLWFSAE